MAEDQEVVYTFRAEDGISGPMAKAQTQLEATSQALAEADTAMGNGIDTADTAAEKMVTTRRIITEGSASARTAAEQASASMDTVGASAQEATVKGKAAQEQLRATATAADTATASQQTAILKSVETMAALHGLQSGLSAITGSLNTLGVVDEETFKTLQKVTAGVQLVVGTAEAIKGVVTLFQSLNAVLKTTAIVSTFAAIAENPLKGAAIVGAAGLAAGAVGGYMMSTINNSKTTTITVAHESTARQAETLTDAGAWY